MDGLEEAINERVSFLKEQIEPSQNQLHNLSFHVQIEALRTADPERVAIQILRKKKELESCRDITRIELLLSELDALEWLQREVIRCLK